MIQWLWAGTQVYTFLTSSQVLLMLLFRGLSFENPWSRIIKLNLYIYVDFLQYPQVLSYLTSFHPCNSLLR